MGLVKTLRQHWRRLAKLAILGIVLGALVVTIAPAVPRRVTIEIRVERQEAHDGPVEIRTVARSTLDRAVALEVTEILPRGRASLQYVQWLDVAPYEVTAIGSGCTRVSRRFEPGQEGRIVLLLSCGG